MRNKINGTRLMFIASLVLLFLSFLSCSAFADGGRRNNVLDLVEDKNGVKFLVFEVPGTPSSANYKHRTYGWNINVRFGTNTWYKNGYIDADSELMNLTAGGTAKLALDEVLIAAGVPEYEFYRNDGTIFIDRRGALLYQGNPMFFYDTARQGTSPKYTDGTPFFTANQGTYLGKPRNKGGYGLIDGIYNEYGINWSSSTQDDIPYYYNLSYAFTAVYQWDRVEVKYVTNTGTELGSKQAYSPKAYQYVTEYAKAYDGYVSNAYKIDVTDDKGNKSVFLGETSGNMAGINLGKDSKLYSITFIYDEVPQGEIFTSLQLNLDPQALLEGTTDNIEVTADASQSDSSTGGDLAFRYWVDTDPSYSNAGVGVNPTLDEGSTSPEVWKTTLSNLSPGTIIYGKVKVYDFELNDSALYETATIVGEIPATVEAYLEMDGPYSVEWLPNDWDNDTEQTVRIKLDATKSVANAGIDSYSYTVNGSSEGSNSYGTKTVYVDIKPSDRNAFGQIPISAFVEVEDKLGNTDQGFNAIFVVPTISNTAPNVSFNNDSPHYVSLPVTFNNTTWDKEDDEKYATWTIENSNGDLIYYSQIEYGVGIFGTDRTSTYFESSGELEQTGGQLTFKESGYYKVKLEVMDERGNEDAYEKTIFVRTAPEPSVANFDMYDFGFPNEAITIIDKSTDPNEEYPGDTDGDITQRIWTKPTTNLDDGTPASVSGNLSGSGGTLYFNEEGTYEVKLVVRDYTYPITSASTMTKEIQIIPPLAVARVTVEGTLKENRKVTIHSRDSLSPRVDPIQTNRNIWQITPMDGQSPSSIKIDSATSNDTEKNILFKEPGRYKVYLKVNNNFSDANPTHPQYGATDIEKIITIEEDKDPVSDFDIVGNSPNFKDNPTSTIVQISDTSYSVDSDIIDKYQWTIWRDNNENNDFSDDPIYNTYNVPNFDLPINFEIGNSGNFKAQLTVKEEFGQPTIPTFITESDKRVNTESKVFSVNWIPDIKFNIPDWAYTDDTLNYTTTILDEEVPTTSVVWTLKRANETNTSQMDSISINYYTENILDKDGGAIRFKESGYYELIATIMDEKGQRSTFSDFIRIYPLPTAKITDDTTLRWQGIDFRTKENRTFKLDGNTSFANDYYGPELHPIDHNKDYWEIIPLDSQGTGVIRIQNGSGGALVNQGNSTKFIRSNDPLNETLLFKEDGRYLVRYQLTNTYNKKSPFVEQVVTVDKDTHPDISFEVIPTAFRDVDDGKQAEMITYSLSASSNDEDIIDIQRIRYRFDSDNDGDFSDESWIGTVPIDYSNQRATVKATHVGWYQFEYMIKDKFGQPTLNEFVTTSDRRESYQYKTIEIDNLQPQVDFSVVPSNKVDIIFTIGEVDGSKTQELNSKINTYIKTYLEANNTDFIDTKINTIETSTISSNDANAETIFNDWNRYGTNPYTWSYDSSTKVISRDDNSYWSGFYDPTFENDKYTFEVELGTSGSDDDDDIGVSFGIKDNNPNGHLAFLISQQGLVSVGSNYTSEIHGHPSGLYQYNGSSIRGLYRPTRSVSFTKDIWHKLKAEVNGKNIKIWWDGNKVVDYTHTSNIDGSFGFFTNSQPYGRFRNLIVTSSSTKSLDEILKEPTWRENATRFVVNISDTELPGLNDSDKYPVILSRMLNDNLYFVELGTNINKTQTENFIADNDGKGTFIYNNNMNTALSDLADYILSIVRAIKETNVRYILLNEHMNYTTFYNDNVEEDPKYSIDNWRYNHNQYYFDNSLGQANFHNIWLSNSVNTFDKVGKYTVEYKTKDNPVGSDDRFDEYRRWSEMMNGPLDIFIHRKPIAQYTPIIVPITSTTTAYSNQTAIDFSGEGGTYAAWQPSFSAPAGSTITTIDFKTPRADDDEWYNSGELYIQGYKSGTWQEIKNYNAKAYTSDPIQDSIDVTGQGYTQVRAYFRMRDTADSAQGSPGDSYFNIGYTTEDTSGFNLSYIDTSYDIDHTSRADKGLVDKEWSWKEVGETTWHNGQLTNGQSTKDYLVRLRVRDMDGPSNLGVWSDYEIVLITNSPMPPIAQFSVNPITLPIENNLTITDTSYDPNGHSIVQWEWKLYKDGNLVGTYTSANPQSSINSSININGIGDYKITLQVRDSSGAWGDPLATSEIYTQNVKVIPVNHSPTADFDITSNESPSWSFPRITGALPSGLMTMKFRPSSTVFHEERVRFNEVITDLDTDNTGFDYHWTFERYNVLNISNMGATPSDIYTFTTKTPFANSSFKSNSLKPGAYKITLSVSDKPPVPPYQPTDTKTIYVTKNYYVIPEISMVAGFEQSNPEILVGDTIKLKATTSKEVTRVTTNLDGTEVSLNKVSENGTNIYWELEYVIPDTITTSDTYLLQFVAETNYGGNGSVTRELQKNIPIDLIALKLIDFRITNIVNHEHLTYPITKDMLQSSLVEYKTGYYVTFQINAKGNPNTVQANVDIGDNGSTDSVVNLVKVGNSGTEEIFEGKFYTNARLPLNTVISLELIAKKNTTTYNYNTKEGWNGRTLIIKGTALEDGRINLIN